MSDAYYSDISRVSNSMLTLLAQSPELYWQQYERGEYVPSEPTPAMLRGHLVHCMVLEPNAFTERYAVMPEVDGRTKEGKALNAAFACLKEEDSGDQFWDCLVSGVRSGMLYSTHLVVESTDLRTKAGKQAKEAADLSGKIAVTDAQVQLATWAATEAGRYSGKTLITQADYDIAISASSKLIAHPELSAILELKDNEIEQRIDFDWNGTPCRCKVDLINKRRRLIIDIKTTQDASPTEFAKSVSSYGYHRQNALYEEAARQRDGFDYRFIFACVETSPPFSVALHQLDDADIATGSEEVTKLIDELQLRREKRFWLPEWSRGINNITLPRWHKQREVIEV